MCCLSAHATIKLTVTFLNIINSFFLINFLTLYNIQM